jgi:autotransporter translocation and assembly factor TamB
MSMATNKNFLRKTGKIFLWVLTVVLSLVLLLSIFINLPAGKRIVRNQITKYLNNKLKTRIEIGSIDYSLPKWVELKNVYVEDQKKYTLFYG